MLLLVYLRRGVSWAIWNKSRFTLNLSVSLSLAVDHLSITLEYYFAKSDGIFPINDLIKLTQACHNPIYLSIKTIFIYVYKYI